MLDRDSVLWLCQITHQGTSTTTTDNLLDRVALMGLALRPSALSALFMRQATCRTSLPSARLRAAKGAPTSVGLTLRTTTWERTLQSLQSSGAHILGAIEARLPATSRSPGRTSGTIIFGDSMYCNTIDPRHRAKTKTKGCSLYPA